MKIWTSLRDNCSYHNNYWSSKKMFSELICQKLPLKFYVILFSKILITTRLIKRNFIYLPLAEPGKSQVSFQSQRRAMPKNAQTTPHLSSFHMLASWCSKCFKLGFNSTWTENFQMYNLDLEKAEEPEIKLSAPIGSYKNTREFQKKKITSASLTSLKPLTMCITTNCGKFLKRWEYQTTLTASWETCL